MFKNINKEEKDLYKKILNIENLKIVDSSFTFSGGNSHVGAYVDFTYIPKGITPEVFFKDKSVVYLAFTKDNKSNIGSTTDFLQRVSDYCKDSRSPKNEFTISAKKYGKMYFRILLCKSFDEFYGDKKSAGEWARKIERIAHSKVNAIGSNTTNILI